MTLGRSTWEGDTTIRFEISWVFELSGYEHTGKRQESHSVWVAFHFGSCWVRPAWDFEVCSLVDEYYRSTVSTSWNFGTDGARLGDIGSECIFVIGIGPIGGWIDRYEGFECCVRKYTVEICCCWFMIITDCKYEHKFPEFDFNMWVVA
jgi:hypothetical protein